jgi:hypothetical protein
VGAAAAEARRRSRRGVEGARRLRAWRTRAVGRGRGARARWSGASEGAATGEVQGRGGRARRRRGGRARARRGGWAPARAQRRARCRGAAVGKVAAEGRGAAGEGAAAAREKRVRKKGLTVAIYECFVECP